MLVRQQFMDTMGKAKISSYSTQFKSGSKQNQTSTTTSGLGSTVNWISMDKWDTGYHDSAQRHLECERAKIALLQSIAYGDLSRELAVEILNHLTKYLTESNTKPEVEVSI